MPSIFSLLNRHWFVGLVLTLSVLLAAEAGWFAGLDRKAYNLGVGFSSSKEINDDVVVVAIDDKSLQAFGSWPWSRDVLAETTMLLARAKPEVIAYHLPLDSAQNEAGLAAIGNLHGVLKRENKLSGNVKRALKSTETSLRGDDKLTAAFKAAGRVVLAMPYQTRNASSALVTPSLPDHMQRFVLTNVDAGRDGGGFGWLNPAVQQAGEIFPPISKFARRVGAVGATTNLVEFHREPLVVQYGSETLPAFALMVATRSLGLAERDIQMYSAHNLVVGSRSIGMDSGFNVYPRYYPDRDGRSAFRVYSLYDILEGNIDLSRFINKTVIVGITSTRLVTPVLTPQGDYISPTLATAHTVSSLLNNDQYLLPQWAAWFSRGLIVLVGLYLMLFLRRFRPNTALFLSLFLVVMIFNAHFLLMSLQGIWLPMMAAVAMLIIGHTVLGARQAVDARIARIHTDLSHAHRQLGVLLQAQGQLDQAFEKFRQCEVDDPLLGQIYNLGLDYERKRQFNKAATVFKFLQQHNPMYNDVEERIVQNNEAANTITLGGRNSNGPGANLVTTQDGMQKPKLGRYQIDSEIGRGAMGMVYLGRDDKIGRTVAIKTMLLSDDIEDDMRDEVRNRFFREAEAAGRLNHPNIVTVYDVGDEQDLAYIAMDYLKGKDLTAYSTTKTLLPVSQVFQIIGSIALALDYAHKQHVVHRDIKPANIIYDPEKRVAKVTDFGVACLTDASKTKSGTILGSPYYMSPEQLAGKKVDGRADLFSLGVTLYQMLTGELPFKGDSIANLMYNIANEAHPDIRRYRHDLPNCVNTLINKVLQKEAAQRFQSGREMAAYMKNCQEHIREMEAA